LPRQDWSAQAQHETVIAERISQLRAMQQIYTFMGTKEVTNPHVILTSSSRHPHLILTSSSPHPHLIPRILTQS
jgi:hypothetical protein